MTQDELIIDHMKWARQETARFYGSYMKTPSGQMCRMDFDDMYGYAMEGLVKAAKSYKKNPEATFKSYAAYRIKGSILDGIRQVTPLSRVYSDKRNLLAKTREQLISRLSKEPTDLDMMTELGLNAEDYYSMQKDTEMPTNFQLYAEDTNSAVVEHIAGEMSDKYQNTFLDPLEALLTAEELETIPKYLKRLNRQQREVMSLIYTEGFMQKEVAELLNLTDGRINQIHSQALKTMQKALVIKI